MCRSHIVNKNQQIPVSIPGNYIMATISKEVNNTGNGINSNKECYTAVSNTVVDVVVNQMAAGHSCKVFNMRGVLAAWISTVGRTVGK